MIAQAIQNDVAMAYHRCAEYKKELEALQHSCKETSQDQEDAARYRWLRDGGNDDIGVVSGLGCTDSGSSNVVGTYEYILDGEQLDSAIDLACRAEEEGNKCS